MTGYELVLGPAGWFQKAWSFEAAMENLRRPFSRSLCICERIEDEQLIFKNWDAGDDQIRWRLPKERDSYPHPIIFFFLKTIYVQKRSNFDPKKGTFVYSIVGSPGDAQSVRGCRSLARLSPPALKFSVFNFISYSST